MPNTVLILGGSGKIGRHAARAFERAGWTVRQYDRARGNMVEMAKGADVIVNGLNPPNYHNWAELIPEITRQVIAAAQASGATVILPGNVYNFGVEAGPWDENTAHKPASRKGKIRVEMEEAYRDAGVQTIVLRAGNFLDPEKNGDIGSLVLFRAIGKGKLSYPGDPNACQAYCYMPDWASAAVQLAEIRAGLARFEDVPLGGLNMTANELRAMAATSLGRPVRLAGFPWGVMRLAAPFWELAREMLDMRYLWSHSHALSDAKLKRLLPDFRVTEKEFVVRSLLQNDVRPDNAVPTAPPVAG